MNEQAIAAAKPDALAKWRDRAEKILAAYDSSHVPEVAMMNNGAQALELLRAMLSVAPAVVGAGGTITAEYHQRVVREAVKAAYERAARRCKDVLYQSVDESGLSKFLDGYAAGCNDCEAAIKEMGESDAE